jgi:hypothetical protein
MAVTTRIRRENRLDQKARSAAPMELGEDSSYDALDSRLGIVPQDFRDIDKKPGKFRFAIFDEFETVSPKPCFSCPGCGGPGEPAHAAIAVS